MKKSVAATSVSVPAGRRAPAVAAVEGTLVAAVGSVADFCWPGSASAELSDHVAFSTGTDGEVSLYQLNTNQDVYSLTRHPEIRTSC